MLTSAQRLGRQQLALREDLDVACNRGRAEDGVERLRSRLRLLLPQDRQIVELVLGGKVSRRQAAALVGVAPGTLARRIQRLSRRLHDPLVVALVERPLGLPEELRQLGIEYFLQGLSTRELAELHRMPRRRVQQMVEFVRMWKRCWGSGG